MDRYETMNQCSQECVEFINDALDRYTRNLNDEEAEKIGNDVMYFMLINAAFNLVLRGYDSDRLIEFMRGQLQYRLDVIKENQDGSYTEVNNNG